MKAENTFEIIANIKSTETDLTPVHGQSCQVPSTVFARKIYYMVLVEKSGTANTVTFKVYKSDGTTLDRSFDIKLTANEVKVIKSTPDAPFLTIWSEEYFKAVASADSVDVVIACFDT